jgi:hypothetical protein
MKGEAGGKGDRKGGKSEGMGEEGVNSVSESESTAKLAFYLPLTKRSYAAASLRRKPDPPSLAAHASAEQGNPTETGWARMRLAARGTSHQRHS